MARPDRSILVMVTDMTDIVPDPHARDR